MRETTVPDTGAKRRLVEAAEALFAEKGFEVVSVRDITQRAGANVAAVNYHFGSREELVTLVLMRYIKPVNEERMARLETAERKWGVKSVPLEEVIEAFVRPLVSQVKKSDHSERLFCRLLGRIFSQHDEVMPPVVEENCRPVFERFIRAFGHALPGLPMEEMIWRLHFMGGGMIHMLTHQEVLQRLSGGASGLPAVETTVARFVRFAAAGFRQGVVVERDVEQGPQVLFDF
jgi:AcrR family transcriptional regulator